MHKIDIPQKFFDACVARRGRLHAFEHIEPHKTALIVVDMQNSWLVPDLSPLEIPMARSIVENINKLTRAARAAGALVAWTKSVFPPDWTSWYDSFGTPEWRDRIIADTAEGAYGHQLYSAMDVQAQDLQVVKKRPSAFIQGSSDLEALLRERGRDTLIITGTLTNACCESSARDSSALGFKNIFVADATATRTDEEHNAALINIMQYVADLRFTDDVVELLKSDAISS